MGSHFQEYDYDVTHCIRINNKNVTGLNWNPSSNELDTTGGMLAWGNKFRDSGAWLACCFILLHFGKRLLKRIMLSSSWIFKHFWGFKCGIWWHWTYGHFWGCPSVDLLTNRGIGCGIDIYRKRLGSSKGENISLKKTIFFKIMVPWACMCVVPHVEL